MFFTEFTGLWVAVILLLGIYLAAPVLAIAGLVAVWYHWLWTAFVLLALAGYATKKVYL